MAGCGVHGTGAGIERHVVTKHGHGVTLIQGMAEADALKLGSLEARERRVKRSPNRCAHRCGKPLGKDHHAAVNLVSRVVELRVEGDGQV